ncbi:hypothetical protein L905_10060 [Agrobacterium sp. TS43]|nr:MULTISPECIES: hypothetical protein [Agrobacterium]KVK40120.1 hypothetical protein L904_15785 [Agrobacterium sp. LY4]KVK51423.1 hypothetical protein L903_16185 [Agrobacterium sp. JL28]KVK63619.1 hypothetical protein L906_16130 [Agrobacterium sp. TS45]KVK68047.1 hypothetical protein L907_16090 [Agrobacterium sp. C13]KVK70651.1 hypothetical protein L905_10060 [Agrobacterium sp. TS43]
MIPDLSVIFHLAIFGLICAVVAVIGGAGWLVWFVIEHVRIV